VIASRVTTAVLLLLSLGGCAGRWAPPEGPGSVAPAAAVERFLQLAAERRYVEMGWVFGTADGPVIDQWPRPEVEQRMYAIARVLDNESFVIGPSSAVPGRIGSAERLVVSLLTESKSYEVPFVVVRGARNRWFVEQVNLEAVTNVP
jgi:hypothetical protein